MKPVGSPRSRTKVYPAHIDAGKLPKKCYWDESGNGHWYTTYYDNGKRRRRQIAGPEAKLSDLHRALEVSAGANINSLDWLGDKFIASPQFKQVSEAQQKSYNYGRTVIKTQPTLQKNIFLGQVPLGVWDTPMVQRVIDKVSVERGPSSAKKVYEYMRRLFNWAVLRGLYQGTSPVSREMELPKERKRRRLPTHEVLGSLIVFAFERGKLPSRAKGACPPYLWKSIILSYECRLRGVEVFDLTDEHLTEAGVRCGRRKGSTTNIAKWNHNLRVAALAAQKERDAIWQSYGRAIPLRPEHRPLIVNESGLAITQSTWQSAWRRFMKLAIREQIITEDQKFGLHDMKRRGTTDTVGTKAEKMDAVGLSSLQILKVYDHSVNEVNATSR